MPKKLSSVVGIDIGSRTIKVCEIRTQGKEPVVTGLGLVDTPEGAVDATGIYNDEAVGNAVKAALQQAGISTKQAVVSLNGTNAVLVRTLEVPKMNPQELQEHMQWEINRNIPFAESTVVSDFKPLGDDDPNSPNMDVVMAIAPQSAIDTTLSILKRAGAQPAAIDVEPLSLARSLERSYGDEIQGKTLCLVDVGALSSAINIYFGGRLLMPRQIPLGGESFTRAIADTSTLSMPEAEQVKRSELRVPPDAAQLRAAPANPFDIPGMPTQEFSPYNPFGASEEVAPYQPPAYDASTGYGEGNPFETYDQPVGGVPAYADPADAGEPIASPAYEETYQSVDAPLASTSTPRERELFEAVAPLLDDLVADVRRSVDYFRSRGGEVDRVILTGGGAKIPGLAEYMAETLGVPCDAYDPFRRLNVNAKKAAPDFAAQHGPEFSVAVGNGLHIFY